MELSSVAACVVSQCLDGQDSALRSCLKPAAQSADSVIASVRSVTFNEFIDEIELDRSEGTLKGPTTS